MEQSIQIDELAKALNKVQANKLFALTDKSNPFFKSKYADLSSVWDAVRDPLLENGLSVAQTFAKSDSGSINIVTTLLHETGQWIRGCLTMPILKQDPQAAGSAITYGRRYALSAMLGICPEDDDGEKGMKRENPTTKPQPKKETPKMTKDDWNAIQGIGYNLSLTDAETKDIVKWKCAKEKIKVTDTKVLEYFTPYATFDKTLAEYSAFQMEGN